MLDGFSTLKPYNSRAVPQSSTENKRPACQLALGKRVCNNVECGGILRLGAGLLKENYEAAKPSVFTDYIE